MTKDLSLYQLNEQKLDATKEAADKLRIDAATINNGLTVETSVPEGAKFTDTIYTHPQTHPPTIIQQDENNRFVTDEEKNSWNAKADSTLATTETNGLMSNVDKIKLNGIEPQANKYTHPVSHPANIIIEDSTHRFFTDTERNKLKLIEEGSNKYIHPNTHPASIIEQDENNRFVTDSQIEKWNNASLSDHTHTKEQIGLGNVDNTSDANKPISIATQEALNKKLEKTGGTISGTLTILGTTDQDALLTKGIQGLNETGEKGDLYLNYNDTSKVYVNGNNRVLDTRDIATTENAGIVQLSSSLDDNSETKAVTAKLVKTLQDTKANISGDISLDFNVKSLNVSGPILPTTTSTIDIGSSTNRFRSIYVDEAYLSTNTLYLGDTPVIGTNQDTVIIKADPDQSIILKTSAGGTTKISSESGTELSTSGMNADVVLKASGSGAKVNVSADQQVNFTAPDINFNGGSTFKNDATIKKNLVVEGDLIVKGQNHIIEAETVQIKDNIIEINKGQIGNGVTAGQAGLKVNRGDSPSYYMIFDEEDDMFKVGMETSLETIASRPWVTSNYEPKITSKGTAFNKNFGTSSGSVSEGNHNHDSIYLGKTSTAVAATKLATARTINGIAFDGTTDITITAEANSLTSNKITSMTGYAKASAVAAITTTDTLNAAIGKLEKGLDGKAATSHTHTAGQITGLPTSLPANGGNADTVDGKHATDFALASHGTHVTYATTAPLVAGTASAGSSNDVARGNHVHPTQTSVSGNAGTATKLATARTISLTGDVTGSVTFDGSANASITTIVADNSHNHTWSNITGAPIATASANGLMSSGDKAKLDTIGGIVTISKSLILKATWIDTGIQGNNLGNGSYVVQVSGMSSSVTNTFNEIFTGFMSWHADGTNSTDTNEIILHAAGHATNGGHLYLRTVRQASSVMKLQVAFSNDTTTATNVTFKFRKLI